MMRNRCDVKAFCFLIGLFLLTEASVAAGPEKERIAVVDFEVQGDVGIADAGKIVAGLLVSEFRGKFELVERTRLEALLREKNLGVSDLMQADKAAQYGKLLPVKYLVVGQVMKGAKFYITAQLVEVGPGTIRSPRKLSAPAYPELEEKIPLLGQLLSMTDEEYKKWLSDTPEKQLARQTEELLATAKANDSKERGKTALTALDKLLKLDPYHAEARLLRSKIAAYYGPTALMVPDQYPTIREAMDAANSGDTVMVKPGIYRDAITFKEGIRLLGTDRGACRIEPVDGALAVITAVACRSGSIENLTLDGRDALLSHRYEIGVQCEDKDGGVWIRQVVEGTPAAIAGIRAGARIAAISGRPIRNVSEVNLLVGLLGRLDGITVELKGAGAEGHRSVIVNPEKMEVSGGYRPDGIALLDCQIEVRDCVVQGIGTGILATGPYSSPVLRGNQCRTNNRHGIVIASSGVVERNICEGNKFTGILAGGVGIRPTIMGNTCRSNGQHGILFTSACGTAEDNTCDENKCSGIVTLDMGAAPMIRRNRCRSNGLHGIEFSQKGGGTAEGNTSEGNTYCGIIVFGAGSAPTLIGNQCRSNKFGIAFSNGSGGIAQGNQCDNNSEWGIWYDGGAQPSIAADNAAFGNAKGQIKR